MKKTILLKLILFLAVSPSVPAATHLVPIDYPTIQAAIDDSVDGDEVVVAPGTYTGPGNRDIDFLGKAITVRSIDPNDPNVVAATIIDCNGTETEPHRGFYFHSGEDGNSVLSGLTITNGYASGGSYWENHGGGIYCEESSSSPQVTKCVIIGNSAHYDGGGISCGEGTIISNCMVIGNSAGDSGGGIADMNGVISGCTISGNSAGGSGGGLVGAGTIINCTISQNSASGGGGLYDFWLNSTIVNCTISGNRADNNGGGLYNCDCPIINCTISGNSAGNKGGGLFYWRSTCDYPITNCTISGNSANSGGGMYGTGTLTNCIFWGNAASEGAQISLKNWSTGSISYCDVQGGQSSVYVDGSSVLDWGGGNIDEDPCFVEPGYWADVNDPNLPVEPNDPNVVWVEGDYRLLAGSPCIDAGDNDRVAPDKADLDGDGNTTEPIPFDLDGNPRVVDGNNDGNAVVDMGAYEFFVTPMEVPMKFTPQALNPGSKGKWVKAHCVLPEGYTVEDVDANTPATLELLGIEVQSDYINVFVNDDNLVGVEIAFERGALCGAGTNDDWAEATVTGLLTSGQYFYGTDTIKIVNNKFKCLAVFASHWLEAECGKPDWCGGADLDQDSLVNLVDFVLFDGCCIEILTE